MTIEEALKTAIEFEDQVRDIYHSAMGCISGPVGKRVFRMLAKEEQDHLDYLQSKLYEWKRAGTITAERLDTTIPSEKVIREGISKLGSHIADKAQGGELQMLTRALDVEVKTSNFYKNMVRELPPEGQELFAYFVEIEEGHLALVRAEIDYLSKTGYWFDFKEFDME
ncbi:MAG: ferritin family protein [Deltaproteobacteria bacterium]|nr:MAG: ferritin family protein [Deltaproteobacteria bacterium]